MAGRGETWQTEAPAVLRRHGGPRSAYRILEGLRGSEPKLAPSTIYGALAALAEGGLVHPLEAINAFRRGRSKR
jgi:Fe2+ or Zn2+ uptake regulation protein